MNLASISENKDREKRIAVTPETAKKIISLGFNLSLSTNYGSHLGFSDDQYKSLGVNFFENEEGIIEKSDIIVQLGLLSDDKISIDCALVILGSNSKEKQLIFFNFNFSSFSLFDKAFKDPIKVWFSFNNNSFSSLNKPN